MIRLNHDNNNKRSSVWSKNKKKTTTVLDWFKKKTLCVNCNLVNCLLKCIKKTKLFWDYLCSVRLVKSWDCIPKGKQIFWFFEVSLEMINFYSESNNHSRIKIFLSFQIHFDSRGFCRTQRISFFAEKQFFAKNNIIFHDNFCYKNILIHNIYVYDAYVFLSKYNI